MIISQSIQPNYNISWNAPVSSWQTLKIYDLLGREVRTLVNEEIGKGYHSIEFSARAGSAFGGNASDLSSGVYLFKLKPKDFIQTKKMI